MHKKYGSICLLDRYLISPLVPNLIFAIAISTIFSELIGISFEQVKFVAVEGLPLSIMAQVHLFKLPAFLALSLPLSVLMATIITYRQLSANREIIALQSFGISLYRLVLVPMAIALFLGILVFILNELVVPSTNYQAAILLETEWGVNRSELAKYNKQEIVYQKFTEQQIEPTLKYLFFADRFDGKYMRGITLLQYDNQQLQKIVTADRGQWQDSQQHWRLFNGHLLTTGNSHALNKNKYQHFQSLSLPLSKDIFSYANHHRDHREMSILELYQRLNIVRQTHNQKNIRQLQISIQERYALPFSCVVFALLGTILGIVSQKNSNGGFTISAIAIFTYYALQFVATSLTTNAILPVVLGVWLPNITCLLLAVYLPYSSNQ